jgi:hypothetical protein
VERTGGETRCQAYQTLYGEAPYGPRESTRTTRNGVNFCNHRRVNENTLKGDLKKGGKKTADLTVVVSKDGKITTVTYTDYSQAKPEKSTAVYDKQ